MITKMTKYMARCDDCGYPLYDFKGNSMQNKPDLIDKLKKNNWKYNFTTKKCSCGCKKVG